MRDKNIYFNWIIERIKEKSRVLDVGCSPGTLSNRLLKLGHTVTGVDLKDPKITHQRFRFIKDDVLEVDFSPSVFDQITACHVLQHIGLGYQGFVPNTIHEEGDKTFIERAHKWLKPDGSIFIVIPIAGKSQYVTWGYRWRVYDDNSIRELFHDMFNIVDSMRFDGAYDTKTMVDDAEVIVIEAKKI